MQACYDIEIVCTFVCLYFTSLLTSHVTSRLGPLVTGFLMTVFTVLPHTTPHDAKINRHGPHTRLTKPTHFTLKLKGF